MHLPLSVHVRIDPNHRRVHLVTTGHLTETNQQTLYPLIRHARTLTPATEVVIDLTSVNHLEGAALDLLRWEIEHDEQEHPVLPVRVALTESPPAGRIASSSTGTAYRTGSTAWTPTGPKPAPATELFSRKWPRRHLPGSRARPMRGRIVTTPAARPTGRSPVKTAAFLYGAVFLLVGLAGFVPGLTTAYDSLQFAGHESEAMLMGVFQVSVLHNVVHLLYGIVGVALARSATGARNYLRWGGAVYLVLWLYGLFVGQESQANFVPLNTADDWLHFVLGVTMVGLSFLGREPARRNTTGPAY